MADSNGNSPGEEALRQAKGIYESGKGAVSETARTLANEWLSYMDIYPQDHRITKREFVIGVQTSILMPEYTKEVILRDTDKIFPNGNERYSYDQTAQKLAPYAEAAVTGAIKGTGENIRGVLDWIRDVQRVANDRQQIETPPVYNNRSLRRGGFQARGSYDDRYPNDERYILKGYGSNFPKDTPAGRLYEADSLKRNNVLSKEELHRFFHPPGNEELGEERRKKAAHSRSADFDLPNVTQMMEYFNASRNEIGVADPKDLPAKKGSAKHK